MYEVKTKCDVEKVVKKNMAIIVAVELAVLEAAEFFKFICN